jgi:ubiquinone/menaquinone biosynthesis C-methylase UbiE
MTHFNSVANEWDSESKTKMMKNLAIKTLDQLNLSKRLDILDFGCGTGLFGFEFKEYVNTLTGIDTSSGMLEVFDKKTKDYENIKSININLEKSSLTEKYDLIVSSMAFHHLNNPLEVLIKLKASLKDKGKIAIVDLDREDGTFHPDNEGMGVKHLGFLQEVLEQWAVAAKLKLEYSTINTILKNEKDYKQFLAIYTI